MTDAAMDKASRVAAKMARKKARRAERMAAELAAVGNDPVAAAAAAKAATLAVAKAAKATAATSKPQTFSCKDGEVDLAEGLVLIREAVTTEEEMELVEFVLEQCERGRRGEVKKPTYLRSHQMGNQREALMYGGFFDFNRARPGKRGLVPPFPPILDRLVERLVDERGLLPADVRPDSVIINSYSAGDCIPPHVDHASYHRPISTLSLQGEEPMLIGSKFRTVRPCTWAPVVGLSVPCPRRSLLVLGGNSGDIAKHCISACSGPRISITLRKQPPPDWKPDLSELVGGGGKQANRERKKVAGNSSKRKGSSNDGDDTTQQQSKKKKKLSGSAKKRKKLAKENGKNFEWN